MTATDIFRFLFLKAERTEEGPWRLVDTRTGKEVPDEGCAWLMRGCRPCRIDSGGWCLSCQVRFRGRSPADLEPTHCAHILDNYTQETCGRSLPCKEHK